MAQRRKNQQIYKKRLLNHLIMGEKNTQIIQKKETGSLSKTLEKEKEKAVTAKRNTLKKDNNKFAPLLKKTITKFKSKPLKKEYPTKLSSQVLSTNISIAIYP